MAGSEKLVLNIGGRLATKLIGGGIGGSGLSK